MLIVSLNKDKGAINISIGWNKKRQIKKYANLTGIGGKHADEIASQYFFNIRF